MIANVRRVDRALEEEEVAVACRLHWRFTLNFQQSEEKALGKPRLNGYIQNPIEKYPQTDSDYPHDIFPKDIWGAINPTTDHSQNAFLLFLPICRYLNSTNDKIDLLFTLFLN